MGLPKLDVLIAGPRFPSFKMFWAPFSDGIAGTLSWLAMRQSLPARQYPHPTWTPQLDWQIYWRLCFDSHFWSQASRYFVKDAEHTNKSLYLLAVWHPAWINTQSILWSLKDSFTFWPQATLLRRATGWQCFCVGCHRTVSFTVAPISGPGDMIGQVKLNDMVGVLWPFLWCERMMLN